MILSINIFEEDNQKKNPNFFNDKGDNIETYTRHFVPYVDPQLATSNRNASRFR